MVTKKSAVKKTVKKAAKKVLPKKTLKTAKKNIEKTTKKSSVVRSIRKKAVSPKKTGVEVVRVRIEKKENQALSNVAKVVFPDEKEKKPKIAILSLTSCEGCQFALLDLGQKFLEFVNLVEMVDFRLLEDEVDSGENLDVVFVEGNPVTRENIETLKMARKRAKILCALGNCAAMGGVPEIKNYHEKANTIKHVYKYIQGIQNPEIKEIDNFVKVDFVFPGCPITGEEFLKYVPLILEAAISGDFSKLPIIHDLPVCVECRRKGNRCLILDKKPCFGSMILGGCGAVCPTSRMMCQGCRGLRPTGNVQAMRATLKTMMTDEEFENTTEIYGLRDDLEKKEREMRKNNL